MPRYYFHVIGDEMITDQEGMELDTLDQVQEEALSAARDILAEAALSGVDKKSYRFQVVDEAGKPVLTFLFADAMTEA